VTNPEDSIFWISSWQTSPIWSQVSWSTALISLGRWFLVEIVMFPNSLCSLATILLLSATIKLLSSVTWKRFFTSSVPSEEKAFHDIPLIPKLP